MTTASSHTREALDQLMETCDAGTVAEKLRSCVNALWVVSHDDGMDRQEMLNAMCLVSGVACAVMTDAATLLEEV